ncbi:hypothetical protein EJB05_47166, partial [Eragrostis curvula]
MASERPPWPTSLIWGWISASRRGRGGAALPGVRLGVAIVVRAELSVRHRSRGACPSASSAAVRRRRRRPRGARRLRPRLRVGVSVLIRMEPSSSARSLESASLAVGRHPRTFLHAAQRPRPALMLSVLDPLLPTSSTPASSFSRSETQVSGIRNSTSGCLVVGKNCALSSRVIFSLVAFDMCKLSSKSTQ